MLPPRLHTELEREWWRLRPSDPGSPIGWSYHLTPPFARDWPPRLHAPLVVYAYAGGHDMGGSLADGIYVAGPWARLEVLFDKDGAPRDDRGLLEILALDVEGATVQGVRPLSPDELENGPRAAIVPLLLTLAAPTSAGGRGSERDRTKHARSDTAAAVRRFYHLWARENGVLASRLRLRPEHRDFFAWLDRPALRVVVCDLFNTHDPEHEHTVTGFADWEQAKEYARRRVRASVEAARERGRSPEEIRAAWRSLGEDARAVDDDGDRLYVASSDIDRFIAEPAAPREQDWPALDPTRARS